MRAASCCMRVGCMSTTEPRRCRATASAGRQRGALAQRAARRTTPIVPRATISGRALIGIVAIMTFLASLTTGAVMLVRSAANEWQADVAREVTIQVARLRPATTSRPRSPRRRRSRAPLPGSPKCGPIRRKKPTRLLEPWLGSGLQFDDLPVPRLIVLRIARRRSAGSRAAASSPSRSRCPGQPRRPSRLRRRACAPWPAPRCSSASPCSFWCSLATMLSVTFATRAAMATNRPVIEVLHLIGAKDNFIAAHFQQHFLQLGTAGRLDRRRQRDRTVCAGRSRQRLVRRHGRRRSVCGHVRHASRSELWAIWPCWRRSAWSPVTAAASRRTVNRTIETIH